jgi:hypothetical protein
MLVLIDKSKPAFLQRLVAELESFGFDVVVVTPSILPPDRAEIEQLSQREGATVDLVLVEAGGGLEIWIADPSTGKTSFHEVILGLYASGEAPETTAIRLVETLRATLIELAGPRNIAAPLPPRRAAEVASAPPVARPARFTVAGGGGGATSVGGIGAMGYLDLSLRWRIATRFDVAVDGALTPTRAKLEGPEGQATAGWYLAGVSAGFCASDPTAAVRFRSGAGVWVSWMSLSGQAVMPYVNTRADLVSAIPHIDAALHVSVTRSLGLAAGLSMGVSVPEASVRFAGREVATWGRPLWMGGLGIEFAFDR